MRTLLAWLARCVPNQGCARPPLIALRVGTAITEGSAAIPTGASGVAAAKAVSPPGDVEPPATPAAMPASPNNKKHDRASALNGRTGNAIRRYGPQRIDFECRHRPLDSILALDRAIAWPKSADLAAKQSPPQIPAKFRGVRAVLRQQCDGAAFSRLFPRIEKT
jgi:hypothetical protein